MEFLRTENGRAANSHDFIYREFRDVVFEDVGLDDNSSVAKH